MKRRVILILAVTAVSGVSQTLKSRVSLRGLTSEAISNNPEIVAAQKRYEAARQRPTQESSLPDPKLSVGYASVGNPLPGAGLGGQVLANARLMVSQEVPFPGKLKLKGDIAYTDAQAEFEQYQSVRLAVASRLKQAYYRLQYTYAISDVLVRNRALLEQLLKATEERYSVGKAVQQDVFKAQMQLTVIETRIVRIEQERRSREAELNSLLNRAAGSPIGRPEDETPKDLTVTVEELFTSARESSPILARDRMLIQRSELAANIARKNLYPDVTLNAGYYNRGGMPPAYEIRADFEIPFYSWRKQRAGVSEEVSTLSQTRSAYEASDQTLRAQIQDEFSKAQASARLMKLYAQTQAPQLHGALGTPTTSNEDELFAAQAAQNLRTISGAIVLLQSDMALRASIIGYETGSVDFPSVLSSASVVLEFEMNYYDEALNYSLALSRLEEITGQPLTN